MDAADRTTPVHPVYVQLLTPGEGDPVGGLGAENNPDGTYEFTDIPPGMYKVYFETHGVADAWEDELYDDIPCDGNSCDRKNLGTELLIREGQDILDVDLVARLRLSGRVTNELDEPFFDAGVEVLNDSCSLVDEPRFTNENGEWSKVIPGPGTYMARRYRTAGSRASPVQAAGE